MALRNQFQDFPLSLSKAIPQSISFYGFIGLQLPQVCPGLGELGHSLVGEFVLGQGLEDGEGQGQVMGAGLVGGENLIQ